MMSTDMNDRIRVAAGYGPSAEDAEVPTPPGPVASRAQGASEHYHVEPKPDMNEKLRDAARVGEYMGYRPNWRR